VHIGYDLAYSPCLPQAGKQRTCRAPCLSNITLDDGYLPSIVEKIVDLEGPITGGQNVVSTIGEAGILLRGSAQFSCQFADPSGHPHFFNHLTNRRRPQFDLLTEVITPAQCT
jgi:hypothetical protein